MKTKINWEQNRIYLIAILGIIIGNTWTFNYNEYRTLEKEYNEALKIIERHYENKNNDEMVDAVSYIEPVASVLENPAHSDPEIAEISAYSAGDGFTPGIIMASGKKVYEGAIACPARFDFGQKINIGEKIYTCEDRMAKRFRNGNYFDIYMKTIDEALAFGRQKKEFTILN